MHPQLPLPSTGDTLFEPIHVAKKRVLPEFLYLKAILNTCEHMLQTIQGIKDTQEDSVRGCAELAWTTISLALAVEQDTDNDPEAFGKHGFELETLSSVVEEIDTFVTRTTTSSRLKRYKDRRVIKETLANFTERLEKEINRFEIPSESDLALWLILRGSPNKSDGSNMWHSPGKQLDHTSFHDKRLSDVIAIAVSKGLRDLSVDVRCMEQEPVARGAISLIWSGNLSNNSRVAVKSLIQPDAASIQTFLHEAGIWSSAMGHDRVLPLLGVARFRNSLAFVSPWMERGSLEEYVKSHPDVNVEQLCADVACGLEYLHSEGIVYGYLRMSTVLVSNVGRACLCSFVAAGSYRRDTDENRDFTTESAFDVFSFGNLIINVLEKRSRKSRQIFEHFQNETVQRPSLQGLGDELWAIVHSCWRIAVAERPTMKEIARKMIHLSEGCAAMSSSPLPNASGPPRILKDISKEIKRLSEHPIAGGGHSDLYLGERSGSEKVALKLVRFFGSMGADMEGTRRRFMSEASLWSQFRHPRILEFYGICNHGTAAFFMVTPYLERGTILEYLSSNSDADRVPLLSQAAEGLLYLHTRRPPVVHGDMKASNILITNIGTAVLTDFGLSKLSHEMTTTMLQGVGSPRWMAPELVMVGENSAGPVKTQKSDIYAYGHVILEVLGNKIPFFHLKEDVHVIVELIRKGRSPRPDGPIADKWLNDSAWAFSRDCTAVLPEERPGIELVVSESHRLRGSSFSFIDFGL